MTEDEAVPGTSVLIQYTLEKWIRSTIREVVKQPWGVYALCGTESQARWYMIADLQLAGEEYTRGRRSDGPDGSA